MYLPVIRLLCLLGFLIPITLTAQTAPQITAEKGANNAYTFTLSNPPVPEQRANAQKEAAWGFLWEFGDGHYSREENPVYSYAKAGNYTVTVHLTPQYSTDKARRFSQSLSFDAGRNRRTPTYETTGNRLVDVVTNHEPVRDEEMLVILTYKRPTGSAADGYVVLGFNEAEYSGQDFKFLESNLYHGEQEVTPAARSAIDAGVRGFIDDQLGDYEDEKIFSFSGLGASEDRRIFLRMMVTNKAKIGADMTFTALVVPKSGDFDEKKSTFEFTLRIEASHDPNRIRVSRQRIAFNKKRTQELTYRIQFQNKGKGSADKVRIAVPLDPGLDSSSVQIIDHKPDSTVCPICPPDVDMATYAKSCLEQQVTGDSIFFTFHNIQLHGTKEDGLEGKEYTKGELTYTIRTNGEKSPKLRATAGITFPEQPVVWTNGVSTQYRFKRYGLKAGLNFPQGFCDNFEKDDEVGAAKNFLVGVTYSDIPVRSGLGWEVEATYSNFHYKRDIVRSIETDNFNDLQEDFSTRMKLGYLDLLGQVKYTIRGIASVGLGAGPSLLLAGTADMQKVFTEEGDLVLLDESSTSKFGLFNSAPTSNQEAEAPFPDGESSLGANLFIDLTVGMPGRGLALGGRYNYRMQSKLFDKKNVGMPYMQLYLQWRF